MLTQWTDKFSVHSGHVDGSPRFGCCMYTMYIQQCTSYILLENVYLHNGYLADTHEVAAAKSAHLTALSNSQLSHRYTGHYGHGGSYGAHGDYRYHGPIAIPHVLHSGHIADTHEVAVAKAEHLAAVAKAKTHGGYNSYNGFEGSYGVHQNPNNGHIALEGHSSYHGRNYVAHENYKYHGPTAVPQVHHDGHIADTHDVSLTKIKHFAAIAKAKAHEQSDGGHYAEDHGYHVAAYHGPLAKPVVLPAGYLADTHEVAAAKNSHAHLFHSRH